MSNSISSLTSLPSLTSFPNSTSQMPHAVAPRGVNKRNRLLDGEEATAQNPLTTPSTSLISATARKVLKGSKESSPYSKPQGNGKISKLALRESKVGKIGNIPFKVNSIVKKIGGNSSVSSSSNSESSSSSSSLESSSRSKSCNRNSNSTEELLRNRQLRIPSDPYRESKVPLGELDTDDSTRPKSPLSGQHVPVSFPEDLSLMNFHIDIESKAQSEYEIAFAEMEKSIYGPKESKKAYDAYQKYLKLKGASEESKQLPYGKDSPALPYGEKAPELGVILKVYEEFLKRLVDVYKKRRALKRVGKFEINANEITSKLMQILPEVMANLQRYKEYESDLEQQLKAAVLAWSGKFLCSTGSNTAGETKEVNRKQATLLAGTVNIANASSSTSSSTSSTSILSELDLGAEEHDVIVREMNSSIYGPEKSEIAFQQGSKRPYGNKAPPLGSVLNVYLKYITRLAGIYKSKTNRGGVENLKVDRVAVANKLMEIVPNVMNNLKQYKEYRNNLEDKVMQWIVDMSKEAIDSEAPSNKCVVRDTILRQVEKDFITAQIQRQLTTEPENDNFKIDYLVIEKKFDNEFPGRLPRVRINLRACGRNALQTTLNSLCSNFARYPGRQGEKSIFDEPHKEFLSNIDAASRLTDILNQFVGEFPSFIPAGSSSLCKICLKFHIENFCRRKARVKTNNMKGITKARLYWLSFEDK